MQRNNILTTQELSKYLKLNEKTIIKMAQTGDLPGFKIGNQWRFYLSTIDEYLQDKIVRSSQYDFSRVIQTKDEILPLSRLVCESCINLTLRAQDKEGVLYELAETVQKAGVTTSLENLLDHLKKREDMLSTGLGRGIAIPHPRNPSDSLFTRAAVVIGRSKQGIDFASPDGGKVHLFFLPCAPDVVLHLKLLSKVAKLLETEGVFKKLKTVKTKENVIKIILETERDDVLPFVNP
ncbi:PTS sugar transporter subunit IIA [Candidatus Omnitrophota bacterium]